MKMYLITTADGSPDRVEGDKLDVNEKTGQTIISKFNLCAYEIVAVIPPTSSVKLITPPKE